MIGPMRYSAALACSVLPMVLMPGAGLLDGSTPASAQDDIPAGPGSQGSKNSEGSEASQGSKNSEGSEASQGSKNSEGSEASQGSGGDDTAVGSLRVAVRAVPPFAFHQDGEFTGFEVELAEQLAARMGAQLKFQGADTVAELFDDVTSGASDIALGQLEITSGSEALVDFSHPVLSTGLTILLPAEESRLKSLRHRLTEKLRSFIAAVTDSDLSWILPGFAVFALLVVHLAWLVERRSNPDFSQRYLHGLWDSVYWLIVTISTVGYGDRVPRSRLGRFLSVISVVFGVFMFAAISASIASSITVSRLQSHITGPEDLEGKTVATVTGSTGDAYLKSRKIRTVLVERIDDAYEKLETGEADAVVFEAPALQYHSTHAGRGHFNTTGPIFGWVSQGFAVSDDRPQLLEQVNRTLIEMIEAGAYQKLHNRWFGSGSPL